MPVVYRKKIHNGLLGVWEINETYTELYNQADLNTDNKIQLQTFKSEHRKLEWLASRVLIKRLLPYKESLFILYDTFGKPYLNDHPYKISITHSKKYVAIVVNELNDVGIDIESIPSSKNALWKIEKIAHKFASDQELDALSPTMKQEQLFIIWGAKESLYKLCWNQNLLFKEHIYIEPFEYAQSGQLKGIINRNRHKSIFTLFYEIINDYLLVYVINE